MTITVVIADDQPLMRTALSMSLSAEPDIEVVAEAGDGEQAVQLATHWQPDVVIMDIRMPRLDGIAATRRLTVSTRPQQRVLVITTFDLDEYVVEALRAGASGFILKDATSSELVHAVRVIAAGDALLAPKVTRRLLDRYARRLPLLVNPYASMLSGITARERLVLMLVAQGLSNQAIGRELHMAESSVKTHVSHLLAKLGRQDRVQLVILAYEAGLIQPAGGPVPSD
ncbi:MAG TPA: response regulator transcription factor [Jatrophihabitans sp.]|nr:response regulator transcription factor [Jatrophihabitans sp.]